MEPKIRFRGFSGKWEETSLGKLVNVYDGVHQTPRYADKGIMFLSVENISTLKSNKFINEVDFNQFYKIYPEKGDILMTRIGDVGTPNVIEVSDKIAYYVSLALLKPIAINPYYLSACIQSPTFQHNLKLRTLTTAIPQKINKDEIGKVECIYSPYKDERQAIALYFQGLDALIRSTTKKIESLKQVKAASLLSMFPQEGETKPRVRFKGFECDWKKTIVGNLGATYSGLSGKTKDDFGQGNAKFVTFLNVLTNAKINTSTLEPVKVSKGEHQNEVKKGDLLFNTSSETPEEVGMCAVMDDELENVYLNSFCFGFRITDKDIDPTFIAYLMRSHIGRRIMLILAQGATRYNLSKNNFCKTELLLPESKAEQAAIGRYFSNLDKQITLQTQRLEKLKQIKSACLDNMFV